MTGPSAAGRAGTADNVVGVEVTIDGMLVIADRLHLVDFPVTLGIRPNIPQEDLRDIVWEQVQRDLTAQGVLDLHGSPNRRSRRWSKPWAGQIGPWRVAGGGATLAASWCASSCAAGATAM
ncbi:ESX-1 secretion-associated protein EspG [Mycobacterium tuberculosis variant africanum]|nr:ESX-1 secretion-associated protein EspG [Mycobacterium tuberculosis variant africanum]